MTTKYIVPAGLVVCMAVFIWAVQSGSKELQTIATKIEEPATAQIPKEPKAASPPLQEDSNVDETVYLPCSKEDFDRADGRYDPIEAYEFGLKIQAAVEAEDIEALFDLVDGELSYGPRRSYALNSTFNELFKQDFKEEILSQTPYCGPVNYKGYFIGSGSIWYRYNSRDKLSIFSIPSAIQEEVGGIASVGWPDEGTVLPTSCFSTEWYSSDNYEEYADQFSITDFGDFKVNMGQYFGREITNLNPIPAWNKTISLVRSLNSCATPLNPQEIKDGYVWNGEDYSYRVIGEIDINVCNGLASSLNNTCSEAFVVEHNSFGGSIGVIREFYAYGLFDLPELGPSIVPLKNLHTLNQSLNYLDVVKADLK